MSFDSLIYLVQFDWPFMLVVLAIGSVTGWVTTGSPAARPRKGSGG
jgi:hypothetical protein